MIPVFSRTFNRAPHATTIVQLETVFNHRLLEGAYQWLANQKMRLLQPRNRPSLSPGTVEKIIPTSNLAEAEKAKIAVGRSGSPVSRYSRRQWATRRKWKDCKPEAGCSCRGHNRSGTRSNTSYEASRPREVFL